jgi:hypothetical protein
MYMLSTILRAGRFATLPLFLLLSPVLAAGCSDSSDAAPPSASKSTGHGASLARAMLGAAPKGETTESAPIGARRYDALVGHMVALIEQKYPGQLDRYSTDLGSDDLVKVTAARTWLEGAYEDVGTSAALEQAVHADPLFSGVTFKSTSDLRLQNTGSGSGTGSSAGTPNLGKGADGRYGDGRTGPMGAARDAADLAAGSNAAGVGVRAGQLAAVDLGLSTPNPDSRLGAYAATAGYPSGTVGAAVHNAIGGIYAGLGTYGEENIGRVFNSPDAKALYGQPVDSDAGKQMAAIEQQYWSNVANEDPYSAGGKLGAAFSPAARDWIQRHMTGWW